jgi:hypothetical protein
MPQEATARKMARHRKQLIQTTHHPLAKFTYLKSCAIWQRS